MVPLVRFHEVTYSGNRFVENWSLNHGGNLLATRYYRTCLANKTQLETTIWHMYTLKCVQCLNCPFSWIIHFSSIFLFPANQLLLFYEWKSKPRGGNSTRGAKTFSFSMAGQVDWLLYDCYLKHISCSFYYTRSDKIAI